MKSIIARNLSYSEDNNPAPQLLEDLGSSLESTRLALIAGDLRHCCGKRCFDAKSSRYALERQAGGVPSRSFSQAGGASPLH